MKIKLFFLISFVDIYLSMIVLPFKTAYVNKNGEIDKNSKEYNSTHFMNDYFDNPLYTTLKLGNPSQEIKVILTYQDCGFKIGLAKHCIYEDEYLSHYNRNKSLNFKYTDVYTFQLYYEFESDSCSAEDSIYFYKDINLKKYENIKEVDFYLGSDTNASLCGVIGFKMDQSEKYCNNISFISTLKSRKIINNYNWIIKYKSADEGIIAIGCNMKDVVSNYNEDNVHGVYSRLIGNTYPWAFDIHEIIIGNNEETIMGHEMWIEIVNDFSFLIGNLFYCDYIYKNFFNDLIEKNICKQSLWHYDYYKDYYIIECDKEKIDKNLIKNFPSLTFINKELGTKIIFEGKELFTETKYKYFFNVMFPYYGSGIWIFGKLFLKKYPVMFNMNQKRVELYNIHAKKSSNFIKIFLLVFGIVVLIGITGVLSYLLGKSINKIRKKKANELEDDGYDYSAKGDVINDSND